MLVNKFMKVLKNLFGNKKISASEIAYKVGNKGKTLDTLGVIVESGSNSNGNWEKWSNGLMIIRQTKTHTISGWVSDGNIYRGNLGSLPDFPVDFIEPPIISLTLTNAFKLIPSGQEGITTKHRAFEYDGANALIGVHCATQKSNANNVKVHLIAIGKWK